MKKLLIVVSLIIIINGAKAQKTADVGIWGGTGTSFGDMTQPNLGRSLGFNYGAFLRYNFNPRVSARLQLINGSIKGEGIFDSHDWTFGPKNVSSLSLMAEINFFRYYLGEKQTPFTTYLLGGIGVGMYPYKLEGNVGEGLKGRLEDVVYYNVDNVPDDINGVFAFHIPFGFGVKFNLGEKVGVGLELIVNRYFDDKLDDLDDPRKYETIDLNGSPVWISYNDEWHNNDYTAYLGLHLTYKINLSKKACPVYEYE